MKILILGSSGVRFELFYTLKKDKFKVFNTE